MVLATIITPAVEQVAYMAAALLFILGIKRLSKVKTARSGNQVASLAMAIAVAVTLAIVLPAGVKWWVIGGGIAAGAILGTVLATRVQMTGMPELVALFNGLGGAASAFVAMAELARWSASGQALTLSDSRGGDYAIAVGLSVLIGAVTLSGSLIAYGKLAGKIWKNRFGPVGTKTLNVLLALAGVALLVWSGWMGGDAETAFYGFVALSVVALLLGTGLVVPIGGADMPVVISLLNSYSGLAACATGFVLQNNLLIVAGSLVGASGLILTQIMCKAMNRSLPNVLFATFGDDGGSGEDSEYTSVKGATAEEAAPLFEGARLVIIVPGYGMAVAQAQHKVRELATKLQARGTEVRYGIHPVAGRMPGHMNVLLAEADVPYEQLFDLDQINGEFQNADVVIVLGANDVCNPVAIEDPNSAIAGMPVLNVWEARTVFVIKRSLSAGYAGIKNPLFERENTLMLFGDAKQMVEDLVREVEEL
jgi:NAD(P) transhydrogenase subunit beta